MTAPPEPPGSPGPDGPTGPVDREATAAVQALLEEARERGFLGPRDVEVQLRHAVAMAVVAERVAGRVAGPEAGGGPASWCDLGSGGGVPGLVLAARWPAGRGLLVEASARRARFLSTAVRGLGAEARVAVAHGRGETLAHDSRYREAWAVVTARSFARPAVTAEIGTGFVAQGGAILVSEPPSGEADRWDDEGLAAFGLTLEELARAESATVAVLRKTHAAGARWPRRDGTPARRPRW